MNIVVSSAGKGRYHARLGDRIICTSYTPFYVAARILKAEGVRWDEPLTMTHEGSETICLRSTIGEASMLTVEDGARGLNLRPYRPSPFSLPE